MGTAGRRSTRGEDRTTTGRETALRVLRRVLRSTRYLRELLERELAARPLSREEGRLATELVYGCVRMRGTLDWVIEQCAGRGMDAISGGLRDILRLGLYQILFLDRVPLYAAVSESVELAKKYGPAGTDKFVNAVLRRAPASLEDIGFPNDWTSSKRISVAHSLPQWLVKRWIDRWGDAEAEAVCRAQNCAPPLTVRVNTLRGSREELVERLRKEGVTAVPNTGHLLAVNLERLPSSLTELPAFRDGLFQVQDVSGMRVVDMLCAGAGERVLDLCAAPGGKATAIAEAAGDRAEVRCVDVSGKKLKMLVENAKRLGLCSISVFTGDAREAPGFTAGRQVDRALADVPCSNTGVLRRRPEVRWRLKEDDIQRLAKKQREILSAAASVVRRGGTVVYSTCSLEPEENEGVARFFMSRFPSFSLVREMHFLPHRDNCDGGYAAKFVKKD